MTGRKRTQVIIEDISEKEISRGKLTQYDYQGKKEKFPHSGSASRLVCSCRRKNEKDILKGVRYVKSQDLKQILSSSEKNQGICCKPCLRKIRLSRRRKK